MKLDLRNSVKTLDGKDFAQPSGEQKPVTLQEAMFAPLTAQLRGDENLDLGQKLKIHRLAAKVSHAEGTASFTAEEIATIKDRAAKLYAIHFLGQMVALLEQESLSEGETLSSAATDAAA
jgi:hypothetical protein